MLFAAPTLAMVACFAIYGSGEHPSRTNCGLLACCFVCLHG